MSLTNGGFFVSMCDTSLTKNYSTKKPKLKSLGFCFNAILNLFQDLTKLVVHHFQMIGDHLCIASFNIVAFYKMNQFSILEQCDSRR